MDSGVDKLGVDLNDAGDDVRCMGPGAAFPQANESHGAPVNDLSWRWATGLDVVAGVLLVGCAVVAFALLPDGSGLRLALALPMLLLVPGYLLIEAVAEPATTGRARLVRLLLALGVSPALVGLLALATALLPVGFRPLPIVIIIVFASLGLGAVALWRRRAQFRPRTLVP